MDIKENFYSKLQQIREETEQLDEASIAPEHKEKIERQLKNKYLGGNPKVQFKRGAAKVTAAGREYTHKITKKDGTHQVERTPYVSSDLEESINEAEKISSVADKIRKIAGPGRVQYHPDHDIHMHTNMDDSARKSRAFKVNQKTGKVSEIKKFNLGIREEEEQLDEISYQKAREVEDKAAGVYHKDYEDETSARRKYMRDRTPESKKEAEEAGKKRKKSAKRVIRFQNYAEKKKDK